MFDSLRDKLSESLRKLTGRDKLTESNIQEALDEVRDALLDADVPLKVVDELLSRIKDKALGQKLVGGLRAGDLFVKVVYDELVAVLGTENSELNLKTQPPAVILMAGLQGAGKTTAVAKLAVWLAVNNKKRVMTVSCDVYRPAAMEQLQVLAQQHKFACHVGSDAVSGNPVGIAREAYVEAKHRLYDVLIVDTAGRLHVQQDLMDELKAIETAVNPIETLLVVDSMLGRDSLSVAEHFKDAVSLTGVIVTKTDSDTRGGVALAMRYVTGCPIKFIGTGEKIVDGLERFYPDRIASRILGMGDVLSLVEQAYQKIDQQQAVDITRKLCSGGRMDLEDLRSYLMQIIKFGGVGNIMDKLPMLGAKLDNAQLEGGDLKLKQLLVVIDSMTKKERKFPANIRASQKQRIAKGSGTSIAAVNEVLRYHQRLQKTFNQFSGGKLAKLLGKMPSFDLLSKLVR